MSSDEGICDTGSIISADERMEEKAPKIKMGKPILKFGNPGGKFVPPKKVREKKLVGAKVIPSKDKKSEFYK